MEFVIDRVSEWSDEVCPYPGAVQRGLTHTDYRTVSTLEEAQTKPWYQNWFDNGVNHREEGGMVACEHKNLHMEWVIEVPDILKLVDEEDIIIRCSRYKEIPHRITIYDDYIE